MFDFPRHQQGDRQEAKGDELVRSARAEQYPLAAEPANTTLHSVFQDKRLSIGLTLPMMQMGQQVVDLSRQLRLAKLADRLGFSALWIRDVPLNGVDYPDAVGHLDP